MSEGLRLEVMRRVARLTFDRPAKRNAVNFAMWTALPGLLAELAARADVQVLVLAGSGGTFSAGADMSEFAALRATKEDSERYEAVAEAAIRAIVAMPKPVIAAVDGYAVGGGCNIALACDLRVGDATTQMGIPSAKLGITYGLHGTALLQARVGTANAKLILLSARRFGLADCLRMGLLDLAAEDALSDALELADEMADLSAVAQLNAKYILNAIDQGRVAEERTAIDMRIAAALAAPGREP